MAKVSSEWPLIVTQHPNRRQLVGAIRLIAGLVKTPPDFKEVMEGVKMIGGLKDKEAEQIVDYAFLFVNNALPTSSI